VQGAARSTNKWLRPFALFRHFLAPRNIYDVSKSAKSKVCCTATQNLIESLQSGGECAYRRESRRRISTGTLYLTVKLVLGIFTMAQEESRPLPAGEIDMLTRSLVAFLTVAFAVAASIAVAQPSTNQQPTLTPQNSGTTNGLIAISPVSPRVVWASGRGGTFTVTTDGGDMWKAGVVPWAETLQFRDVRGVSATVAYPATGQWRLRVRKPDGSWARAAAS
jgi:hypothetical protein